MTPQRTDLVLAADVPDSEADVLVLHRLHVEPDGGNSGHDLAQLQLVKNRRLTSSVQANCERLILSNYHYWEAAAFLLNHLSLIL